MPDTPFDQPTQDGRFEQVLAEILEGEEAGLKPDVGRYLTRFPDLADRLRSHFADRAAFDRIASYLSGPSVSDPLDTTGPRGDDTVRPAPQAGDVVSVPGYEIRGRLGSGGMGEVLLVHDPNFGRSLAVKVMLAKQVGQPGAEDRFLAEARITGRLQHPGIPPVHEIGRLPDRRPFMVMKQIQGRTLDDLLKGRPTPSAELPRFVAIFGQICQAVGYAHGQGVIHRDLKPHNVMIGAFGEVQVMDWGLAKELRASPASQAEPFVPETAAELTGPLGDPEARTEDGAILGTPAYMPPEAARGEINRVDERSDVFGLGAILCVILTGRPPFVGPDAIAVALQSGKGNVADAFALLDACSADPELIALARRCLSPEMDRRPRDGAEVAAAVQAYQAAVEERARRAEAERAAAQARAEEAKATAAAERRARRVTLGLAVAAVLAVIAGGTVAWVVRQQHVADAARQESADNKARDRMSQARELLKEGWKGHDFGRMAEARALSEQAVEIATGASDAVRVEAALLSQEVEDTLTRARKNRDLTATVLDVTEPRETELYEKGEGGKMGASIQPSEDEQFANAFRRWGADIDRDLPEQVFAQLKDLPEPVRLEVVAALDEWTMVRRRSKRPRADWQRLHDLAERLDGDESRRDLRRIRVSGKLHHERALIALARALSAGYPLSEPIEGPNARRLKDLALQMDKEREPVLGVMMLSRALEQVGETGSAEAVLRSVLNVRPNEVILLHALGNILDQQLSRVREAVEWYRAARGLRPQLGIALGHALQKAGRGAEGEEVIRDLVRRQPDNPESQLYLGDILADLKKLDKAVAAYRKVIELSPDSPGGYNNLGNALADQRKLDEAVAAFRKVIDLSPDLPEAHNNLGLALTEQKKLDEAVAAYRKAIELRPDYATAYYNMGGALTEQKKLDDAVAAYRKAIDLRPDFPEAYYNLGIVLRDQKKQDEAVAAYRRAIELNPGHFQAYNNLGNALRDQKKPHEAIAAFRKAIDLRPDLFEAYNNLGTALRDQKKPDEAMAAYRKAMELRPDHPTAYYNLGIALVDQKKLGKAIAAFRKAIELSPDYLDAYTNLGNALRDQKKPDEAVAAYRKAIELSPDVPEAYTNLGNALRDQNKLDEAVAAYRKAIEFSPDHAEAYNNLGNALGDQKKPDEAIAAFRKAIKLRPNHPAAYYNLGIALVDQKKLGEAVAAFHKTIELSPDFPDAYLYLGIALADQKKPNEAVAAFRRAIELNPHDPMGYYNLGIALADEKKPDEAIAAFRKVIELRPDDPEVHYNLGNALRDQKKPREAITAYRKAIELRPDYLEAYNYLGIALADEKKPDEAVAAFRKAIELRPDFSGGYNNLGNALAELMKLDEAIAAYRKAIELRPDDPEAYNNLGIALAGQKKPGEAVAAFRKAIALRPDYPLAHYNLGTALRDEKRLEQAVIAFRKAAQLLPGHSVIARNLRVVESWIEFEKQFPMIQAGKGIPQTPLEKTDLALFCKQYKEHHRAAIRFYADAFAAEPQLVNDLDRQHRFHAASCALLVAAGKGMDAAKLPEMERDGLRKQALDWLRADLEAYTTAAEKNTVARSAVQGRLAHWKQDADLSSIREAKELATLPEQERKSWQKLWADVDALLQKLDGVVPMPPAPPKDNDPTAQPLRLADHSGIVLALGFSPDGARLVTGDSNTARVWDTRTGKVLFPLDVKGHVFRAQFSTNGLLLTLGNMESTVRLWDAATGKVQPALPPLDDTIREAVFTPDGKRIVCACANGTISVFDVAEKKWISSASAFDPKLVLNGLAANPDGNKVCFAVGKGMNWSVLVWDLTAGKQLLSWQASERPVWSVAWSGDGTWIASGGVDQMVCVWHSDTGKLHKTFTGPEKTVARVALDREGRRVGARSLDGTVRVWDLQSGKNSAKFQCSPIGTGNVAFSSDGGRLAASAPGIVQIWNLPGEPKP